MTSVSQDGLKGLQVIVCKRRGLGSGNGLRILTPVIGILAPESLMPSNFSGWTSNPTPSAPSWAHFQVGHGTRRDGKDAGGLSRSVSILARAATPCWRRSVLRTDS